MKITVSNKFTAITDTTLLGRQGEMNSRVIEINQPYIPEADNYRLRFEYDDGAIYDVPIMDNKVIVTKSILHQVGEVRCQWIATKIVNGGRTLIAKSNIIMLKITEGLGDSAIPSYEEAQKKLDDTMKIFEEIKENNRRLAYDNALIQENYSINPVILRIPGSVEYVKDNIYNVESSFIKNVKSIRLDYYNERYSTIDVASSIQRENVNFGKNSCKSYYESVEMTQSSLRHLILDEGIKQIGHRAFYGQQNLDRIDFPESLEWVHGQAFEGTKWLNEQTGEVYCGKNVFYKLIPDYIAEKIGYDSSIPCSNKTEVKIKDNTKTISTYAFYHPINSYSKGIYGLKKITLPDGLIGIGDYAFYRLGNVYNATMPCEINIPDTVTWIGAYAFYGSMLKGLKLPPNIDRIQTYSFYECDLSEQPLEIPETVKVIEDYAFEYAKITNLVLHEGLEYIGAMAFTQIQIVSLEIPESVKFIGTGAFRNCNKLQRLHIPSTTQLASETGYSSVFYGCNSMTDLTVGKGFNPSKFDISSLYNLTLQSLTNIIENLADRNGNITGQLIIGSSNIEKLPEELKTMAIEKNYTLS